jgi:hypothetical protein
MKRISLLFLFLIFAGLLYLSGFETQNFRSASKSFQQKYLNAMLANEIKQYQAVANYNIDVELNTKEKLITAKEVIVWINRTNYSTQEIQFHLYPNAYKSDKTEFAKGYNISFPEARTELKISNVQIDGTSKELVYFNSEVENPHDSTVAKIFLKKSINPGDSVKINFDYTMKIPRSVKRLGYATGRNFFFISQWFPKVGVFENGKWVCSPYYPYLNFYSDFGNYRVSIRVPSGYSIAATGNEIGKSTSDDHVTHNFVQNGVHDFVWLASDEILHRIETYTRKDGSQITIHAFVQPEREKYFDRYFNTVKNCLEFFEDNIGVYPYHNISLVDVPRTCAAGGMEYPTLFTVSAELFSPISIGWPEYLVTHEFSHQFFQGILANNEVYSAWLDEGFASYVATKIMYKYYPNMYENFKFATYVPVYGLNFLSYNEIPLIYTLAELPIPEGSQSITSYYKNLTIGTMADTSCKLPTRLAYVVNSYSKPELVLLTLERYLSYSKMMNVLRDYFNGNKYKHPAGNDFINAVQRNTTEDMTWFFNDFYRSAKIFDYTVSGINKISENEYGVVVERLGDGVFRNDIALYTDKDTLYQKWDGKNRWQVIHFRTANEVVGAEIDPQRKNLLDINFANNSYTTSQHVWASLSLSMRWFFWIQNALMILGSVG